MTEKLKTILAVILLFALVFALRAEAGPTPPTPSTGEITEDTDKKFVTDAEKTLIGDADLADLADGELTGSKVGAASTSAAGSMSAADKEFIDEIKKNIYPCQILITGTLTCDGSTDDSAAINECITNLNSAGGGTALMPFGKMCAIASSIVPKDYVLLDLNTSVLIWTGAASGTMVENDASGDELYYSGLINGQLCGEGCGGTTLSTGGAYLDIHSSYGGEWSVGQMGYTPNADFFIMRADVAAPTQAWLANFQNNVIGPINHDAGYTERAGFPTVTAVNRRGFRFIGEPAAPSGVTNNTFKGPIILSSNQYCFEAARNTDTMVFTGNILCTLTSDDTAGAGLIYNNSDEYCTGSGTPIACCTGSGTGTCNADSITVYGYNFDHVALSSWYRAAANMGKAGVILNKSGTIKIDDLQDDAVKQSDNPTVPFWGMGSTTFVVDNYSQSYDINVGHGWYDTVVNKRQHLTKNVNLNQLDFLEAGASPQYRTILQAGDQAANLTYTFPTAYPASSGYTLSSTTGGVLSWSAAGTIGGSAGSTDNVILRADGTGGATLQASGCLINDSSSLACSVVDDSPNFSVNTVTPTATRYPANLVRIWDNGQTNSFPSYQLIHNGGSQASQSATASGVSIGKIIFTGSYDASNSVNGAIINAVTTGAYASATNAPTDVTISTASTTQAATERMRITSTGNVGIGTTAPTVRLHVSGGGTNTATVASIDNYSDGATYGPAIIFSASDSDTVGTVATTQSGDYLGQFSFRGTSAAGTPAFTNGAIIRAIQNGSADTAYVPTDIHFMTTDTTAAPAARLIVAATGGTYLRAGEVIKTASATLTNQEIWGTIITNYGETDDANSIQTAPDIDTYPGANFIMHVAKEMTTYDFCLKANTDNKIWLGATAGTDNQCVCNTLPAIGDKMTCYTATTGASEADIFCEITRGPWTAGACP